MLAVVYLACMKLRILLLCLALTPWTATAGEDSIDVVPPKTASTILADVRSRMPREPILLVGQILRRWHNGRTERLFNVDISLRSGDDPSVAEYAIRTLQGDPVELLTVRRNRDGRTTCVYSHGTPLRPAAVPNLSDPVRETHMNWLDLTLAFLWWQDATLAGTDKVKGYLCDVVDVRSPPEQNTEPVTLRLWIEEEYRVLLKVEERDASGRLLRRLEVKRFKKIGDEWMIGETMVQRIPERQKTLFRILDIVRPSSDPEPSLDTSTTGP